MKDAGGRWIKTRLTPEEGGKMLDPVAAGTPEEREVAANAQAVRAQLAPTLARLRADWATDWKVPDGT